MKVVIVTVSNLILFTLFCSCNYFSDKLRLQAENDSLLIVTQNMENELSDYINAMSVIQSNLAEIRRAEQSLTINNSKEFPALSAEIDSDLAYINDLINRNRFEIDSLSKQLKNSNLKIAELSRSVQRLSIELDAERDKVIELQQQVATRDLKLKLQNYKIEELTNDIKVMIENAKQEEIKKKSVAINENDLVWVAVGNLEELKIHNVLDKRGKVIVSTTNEFLKKLDKQKTQTITIGSNFVKILTKHSKSTYQIQGYEDGTTIHIVDVNKFWKTGKFLVVQTD